MVVVSIRIGVRPLRFTCYPRFGFSVCPNHETGVAAVAIKVAVEVGEDGNHKAQKLVCKVGSATVSITAGKRCIEN